METSPVGWNLHWVTSDGFEDCFVAARNARSARSIVKTRVTALIVLRCAREKRPGRSYLDDRPKYRKSGGGWPFISGIR
jgi:hypothetical protein